MKQRNRWWIVLLAVALVAVVVAGVCVSCRDESIGTAAVRERIAINASADSWIRSGADLRLYSDAARSTETGRLDGAGGWQVAAPTAQPTATPAFSVYNAGVGSIVDMGGSALEYQFDTSAFDVQGNYIEADLNTEHLMLPSVITATVAYTPASGTVATIGDGEIWFVHGVFVRTTTNFDCTGDDCTLTVGDGNDADGFLALADASLQAAFTEATGFAAGWAGIENGSAGAYTTDDGGPFVYAPSGAAETIDYAVGGTDPAAGLADVWVVYTRIQ